MRIPAGFAVGAATHTGRVRASNEDDYLVLAPEGRCAAELLAAVADGLGGNAGGAEASRSALRGFASASLSATAASLREGLELGFRGAGSRVAEQAAMVPGLAEMGTTLVAAAFSQRRVVVGHIGDSRAYLLRDGSWKKLTTDHAAASDRNQLTRCLGGGSEDEVPDVVELELQAGDRLVLCSDGIWGYVDESRMREAAGSKAPSVAAERLVALSIESGGADNATAIVVEVREAGEGDAAVDVELPREESFLYAELPRGERLGAPRWPVVALVVSALVLVAVWLRAALGFDIFVWFRNLW